MELIWNDLHKYGYLLMVSDGLIHYISIMSFSWILANPKGQWLAAVSGPSMGWGSSLHDEGDVILSGALFL